MVKFIYDSYLQNVPLYIIKKKANELGFKKTGNVALERVLTNPVYAGMLNVQAYKEYPGGLFPAIHEAIIDMTTWRMVQSKIKKPEKLRTIIDENIPLRGILKCHCGIPLTGAASRGKSGKYFYYYKCNSSKHNNISAIRAHNQFLNICELMSLPEKRIREIKDGCNASIEVEMKANKHRVQEKKIELENVQEKMFSVEEKWIKNEIAKETYDRWYATYDGTIQNLKQTIERLNTDQSKVFLVLENNLGLLTNMHSVYSNSNTLQKREFISMVFDNNLYYQGGIYRTPTMRNIFTSNVLLMKEKGCLIYEKKRDDFDIIPSSGVAGNRTRVQTSN
ncbi:recombinase family protein [Flavobacterium sp.]|uniref:recombinase family protein n=1 Tax=Flavobacterium sp. TaxID=239 RepID=UPI0037A09C0C